MKVEEKLIVIKWYISGYCALGNIQTRKGETNDLNELEYLVMNDRAYPHCANCSTCYHENRNTISNYCSDCNNGSKYTFPYGYWKRFYEREQIK